jgi:hypothetical protein
MVMAELKGEPRPEINFNFPRNYVEVKVAYIIEF